nr:MAG TPA: hypothetical protein [Caudoviricetes sp.]
MRPAGLCLLSGGVVFFVARKQGVSVKYPAAFRLQFQKAAIFGRERRGGKPVPFCPPKP